MGRQAFYFDWVVFTTVAILLCLGLVTLLSIDPAYFYQQILIAFLGICALILFTRIDFSLYHDLDKFIYIGSVAFLLLTYLGPNVRGATRWLELAGFRLQPSELIKPFFMISVSSLLIRYPPTKIKHLVFHLLLFVIPFLLIFRQPDLGNALIFTSIWLALLIIAGIPILFVILGTGTVAILSPLIYNLLRDYQKNRLLTFINPLLDPRGAGYNALQSMIAVGSGKFIGRGFGRGTQSLLKFLPERHTDFIFASFTEEFGFVGSFVLLALFFLLLWRLLKQAEAHKSDVLVHLYIIGLFIQIFTHLVINVSMNMGLLPITGITLPLVSYGGSSLVALCIGLGIYFSAIRSLRTKAII